MTKRNLFCVASEDLKLAEHFCQVNGVPVEDLFWLGQRFRIRGRNDISVIWVVGEIGNALAEEVHLHRVYLGVTVKYAELNEIVAHRRG